MSTTPKNPKIVFIPTPKNLDKALQELALALAYGLPWLEKAFPRARKAFTTEDGKEVVFPEAYEQRGEYADLRPNDHLKAYCFIVAGRGEPIDYKAFLKNNYRHEINIIFWFNLKKLDSTVDYIYTESLKEQILETLRARSEFQLTEIIEDPEEIFQGFTINKMKQYFKYPFGGFRFSGNLFFPENC